MKRVNNKVHATTKEKDAGSPTYDCIAGFVMREFHRYQGARSLVDDTWLEAWASYVGSPEALSYTAAATLHRIGDVKTDWRHRLSTGKAYELVETAHSYLMSATFPTRDWFTCEPVEPGDDNLQVARLLKRLLGIKLEESNFKSHYARHLRQLLITGTSVLALPWRAETKVHKKWVKVRSDIHESYDTYELEEREVEVRASPDYEVLDTFDCYFEPHAVDPNEGNFIRRFTKTKDQLLEMVRCGVYTCDESDIDNACSALRLDDNQQQVKSFVSMYNGQNETTRLHTVYEFWGDICVDGVTYHDVVATVMGGTVLRFEPNPYWSGRPFVVATFIPLAAQPYAMGYLQPALGMLHELDIVTNQRLDNLEVAINNMYTLKADGHLQPDDVFTLPGKVLTVTNHDDIMPLPSAGLAASVTYQESQLLETAIDKVCGSGSYVGANSQRSGERVTALEVQAVRDAGGNRLNGIHKHIEASSLIPLLQKSFELVQQFTSEPVTLRVPNGEVGGYDYMELEPNEVSRPMKLRTSGSDHVIDSTKYIDQRVQFLATIAQDPEMASMIDKKAMLMDILTHSGFDDPESYLKHEDVNKGSQFTDPMAQGAAEVGGAGMGQLVQQNMEADGGLGLASELYGTQDLATTLEEPQDV